MVINLKLLTTQILVFKPDGGGRIIEGNSTIIRISRVETIDMQKCVRFIFSSDVSGPVVRAGSDRECGAARDGGCGTGGRSTVQQYSSTATHRETVRRAGWAGNEGGAGRAAGPHLASPHNNSAAHRSAPQYCTGGNVHVLRQCPVWSVSPT